MYFSPPDPADLLRRLERLTPAHQRRWGRMTVDAMVCHLADQLRMALGHLPTRPIPGPLRYFPFKQLAIGWLPWPKGKVQGPPEAFTHTPTSWDADLAAVKALFEQVVARDPHEDWLDHPIFGRMSGRLWKTLSCRHLDHHLRQFGV